MYLVPPGSTDLEKSLDDLLRIRFENLPTALNNLWNPQKCPSDFLPFLAWSFSVDNWDTSDTDEKKRSHIENSVWLHKRKGTVGALKRALSLFGASVSITEWWQHSPQGAPHTFGVQISLGGEIATTVEALNNLKSIIDAVKPVRSHYTMETTAEYFATINIGATLNSSTLSIFEATLS
jgi:phage tail P2-like protein